MYIDIKKWNEKDISKKLMEVSFKLLNKLKWQDQDALNIVFDDKCIYLSKKYNYILNMKHKNAVMMQYLYIMLGSINLGLNGVCIH